MNNEFEIPADVWDKIVKLWKKERRKKMSGGGIGFTGMLAILFIALKLFGVISWAWVWVLSPLWIAAIIVAICIIIYIFVP